MQKISEAFLAHTLVAGEDGRIRRVIDHMNVSGGDWRLMLPPPKDVP